MGGALAWHRLHGGQKREVVVVGAFERNISCGGWPAIAKGVIQNTRRVEAEDATTLPRRPRNP